MCDRGETSFQRRVYRWTEWGDEGQKRVSRGEVGMINFVTGTR